MHSIMKIYAWAEPYVNFLYGETPLWCVSYSHEWGVQWHIFFCLAPWGPGEGSKGQILFNFNYKVNFKDFYAKLCACSHK